jgi:uncharacterized secreted protein with C-terminal beta-propeller domain
MRAGADREDQMGMSRQQRARSKGRVTDRRRRAGVIGLAALTAFGLAAGCASSTTDGAAPPTTSGSGSDTVVLADLELASALQPFDACEDLLGYVQEQALERVTAYGLGSGDMRFAAAGGIMEDSAAPMPSLAPDVASGRATESSTASDQASAGGVAGTDYSTTNVQEEGVDEGEGHHEPDTIKSDNRRILAVTDGTLQYVDVTGDAPVVKGSLDLPDDATSQLLVDGDRVLVISQSGWAGYDDIRPVGVMVDSASYPYPGEVEPEVTLTLVDAADPANLRVLTSVRIDGSSVSSRMVDGRARIVTTASPTALPFVYPSGPAGEETALETNRRIIEESTIDDWLPHVRTGTETEGGNVAVACEDVRHPKTFGGFDVLTVQTVDLDGDQIATSDATAIMANGQTVYASAENLYVSTPSYVDVSGVDGSGSTGRGSGGTAPPGTIGGTVPTEPDEPTTTVVDPDQDDDEPWQPPREETTIHRFGIGDDGPAVYRSSGEVPGSLLNQFSMSEHDDRLRVATTDGWGNGTTAPESWVRVLEERDGALVEVGAVGGLGKGEQIKSVRFIDDTGYVVTFRQTDPLYTVDLSDPTAPAVVGELKILGYSAYLHPAGDGLLIGIGQDATEQGRTTGTQVALFDVSDPANPTQIQKHLVGVGGSSAEQDHHAFLWWAATNLAMIPVQNYDQGLYRNGAVGYTVTPDGITELGYVSHPYSFEDPTATNAGREVPDNTVCGPELCAPMPPTPCPFAGPCPPSGSAEVAIDRALVIGDRVYTVSATGVLASRLDDLSTIAGVDFAS